MESEKVGKPEDMQQKYNSLKAAYEREVIKQRKEKLFLEKIVKISEEFLRNINEVPDYKKILRLIKNLTGAKYALFNLFDEKVQNFKTVEIAGIRNSLENADEIIGFNLLNNYWNFNPERHKKMSSSTITYFSTFYDHSIDYLPSEAIEQLEKSLNLGPVYILRLSNEYKVLGDFTLIFEKGKKIANEHLAELYVHQVGLFIERNKTLNVLNETQKLHNSMISNISDVITIIRNDGTIKYISPNVETLFGWKPEEMLEKSALHFIHHDYAENIRDTFYSILNNKFISKVEELFFKCKDGSYKPIKATSSNHTGNPVIEGILVNFSDISSTWDAIQAMKEAEWKFKALFEKGPIGVAYHQMIFDAEGKATDYMYLDANKSFRDITGIDPRGKTLTELFPIKDRESFDWVGTFALVAQTGKKVRFERYFDSNKKWYDIVGYQYKPGYFVSAFLDITKRKKAEQKIEQTHQNYETFFDTIDDFLFVIDLSGNLIHSNKTVSERLGYNYEELEGMSILQLHPEEFRDEAQKIIFDMLEGKADFCPLPIITKEGTLIPVETRVSHGFWDGNPVIFGVSKDITKIKLSEEKFSKLFYINPSACVLTDLIKGNIVEINEQFSRLFEITKEEAVGKPMLDLGLIDREAFHDIVSSGITGVLRDHKVSMRTRTGKIKHVLMSSEKIVIQNDRLRYTVINDYTERLKAEEELQNINQKWEAIIAASPDGIGLLTMDGKLELMSEQLKNMYDYHSADKSEFIGKSIFQYLHPSSHGALKENIKKLLEGKKTDKFTEYLSLKADNSTFNIEVNSALIYNKEGQPNGILFVERDITDRKKAEQELLIAKEKAEESDRLKSAFLANMSHEIRTPINGILGFTGLLKNPEISFEKQQKYIGIIEKSGVRMLNIINDIINISKVESGQMEVVNSNTNINDLIEYLYTFFKPECDLKNIRLSFLNSLTNAEGRVVTDKEKLYAVLTNLVKNAIKFTTEGSVEFGYTRKNSYFEFFVRDTGLGIKEEHKEIIFERFRQGNESVTRNYEGAGLGLSISKAYIEMMGGKLWLESEENKGSTFYFTIPEKLKEKQDLS